MSRGLRGTLVAIGASGAILAATAPGAGAAITVGSDLQRVANSSPCGGGLAASCTASVVALAAANDAAGGATVPQAGVVVRWRVRREMSLPPSDVQARLRVIRANAGVGQSDAVTLPAAAGTYEFATRLPVAGGDAIGIDVEVPPLRTVLISRNPGTAGDLLDLWVPPLAQSSTTPTGDNLNRELMLNADIEPDADGDGFGDETQDLCPSNPATQLGCDAGAPDTTITKKPKKKSTKTKATIKFASTIAGATFQCSLDSVAYRGCTSPRKLKRLKKGKHIFLVRALAAGIPDPTPASTRFTVKKKKKKRR